MRVRYIRLFDFMGLQIHSPASGRVGESLGVIMLLKVCFGLILTSFRCCCHVES